MGQPLYLAHFTGYMTKQMSVTFIIPPYDFMY